MGEGLPFSIETYEMRWYEKIVRETIPNKHNVYYGAGLSGGLIGCRYVIIVWNFVNNFCMHVVSMNVVML